MAYKKSYLKSLEQVFIDLEYKIRYEKGNFNSGYCLVEDKKVVVVNKFYDHRARFEVLMSIIKTIKIEIDKLSETSLGFLSDQSVVIKAKQ